MSCLAGQHHEVRRVVIQDVFVYVMDDLARLERSSQHLLGHHAVRMPSVELRIRLALAGSPELRRVRRPTLLLHSSQALRRPPRALYLASFDFGAAPGTEPARSPMPNECRLADLAYEVISPAW